MAIFAVTIGLTLQNALAPTALAQSSTLTGTIIDKKTGRPLPEASIRVEGASTGVLSNSRGQFTLTGVSGRVRLAITHIGYLAGRADAEVGGAPIRVELVELVVKLDELVVTGTPGEAQQRSLGNVIGRVDVANNVVIAPPAKLQDLLAVNVPGVSILRSSGAIGAGGTTRIRGAGSLSLANDPLIYIDGVRVNNTANAASQAFFGAQEAPSRINDLNPEEIESIEVLKGPSAATIYGTEASNGVIQIITKRGKQGRPLIDTHMEAGANWLQNPEGRYSPSYYLSRDGNVKPFNVLTFNQTYCLDPAKKCPTHVFSTGTPVGAGASLSGGTEQIRYFFSVDGARDEGMVNYNWQNKFSGRANISYANLKGTFKADLSLGAVRSKLRGASGFQPITTSIIWACNFSLCEPAAGADSVNTGWNNAGHGYQFYRPEDYDKAFGYDNQDRTTFSLKLSHQPFPWLRHHLTVGPDLGNSKSSNLIYRDLAYHPFFDSSDGLKTAAELRSTFLTADYGISADVNLRKDLIVTTSAGAQYYSKQFDYVQSRGDGFAIPGPGDITGAGRRNAFEVFQENKTFGVYGQGQVAWKNRVFVTGALRGDGNSAFGKDFTAVYYPKLSFSWVASEEPFLRNQSWLSQLKIRGAWGKAGQQPDIFSAIQTYSARVGSQGLVGVTPQNFGNTGLRPEVGQEFEAGIDAGLFNQRVGVELTFYNKDIKDAIISIPLKPSRGFPGFQFSNIGATRNRGVELAIDATPVSAKNVGLDLRFSLATNHASILDLGGQKPSVTTFASQWNVEGFAPGSFFMKRVVSATVPATRDPSGIFIGTNIMCEGGPELGRGDGTVVKCADAHRIYQGQTTPTWTGSFSATLTIGKRLRLLGLVEYAGGHSHIAGDVAAKHTFFHSSKAALDGSDPILAGYLGLLAAGEYDPNNTTGLWKAGFARLRTISASYELPPSIAGWVQAARGSVTVSGENLAFLWRAQKTLFQETWIDPEIIPNGGYTGDQTGRGGYSQESWPQTARVRVTVRLTY